MEKSLNDYLRKVPTPQSMAVQTDGAQMNV